MDAKIVKIFVAVGGIAGIGLAVFFYLMKDIIAKATDLPPEFAYSLMMTIVWISSALGVLCIGAWLYLKKNDSRPPPAGTNGNSSNSTGNIKAGGNVQVIQTINEPLNIEALAESLLSKQAELKPELETKHGEEKRELEERLERLQKQHRNLEQTYEEAKALITRLQGLESGDARVDALRAEAAEKIQAFDLGAAERALVEAEEIDLAAITKQEANLTKRKQSAAATLVSRAELAKLNYDAAKALTLYKRAVQLDPESFILQMEAGRLAETTGDLGEAKAFFSQARALAEREGDDRNISVALNDLGDVQVQQGDLASAQESFAAGLEIRERLAASDPSNAEWQRDLSVSYNKIGDVQVQQGDLASAQESFAAGLEIRERLAASDPSNTGWQRDLSVSHSKIGDVQTQQGDLASAQESFAAVLEIFKRLAASDPSNAGWQRDLSVSHSKIGDVQTQQGDLASAQESFAAVAKIFKRLAVSDPSNAGWQRDLSVSYNKIGDVQIKQRDLASAQESFAAGLEIRERLAASDPSNAEWQRDLSVSYNKVGDVQVQQGDLASAQESFAAGLEIAKRLAASDPSNAEWQTDIVVSLYKLSGTDELRAAEHLREGLSILEGLKKSGRLAPNREAWIDGIKSRLRELGETP